MSRDRMGPLGPGISVRLMHPWDILGHPRTSWDSMGPLGPGISVGLRHTLGTS